MDQTQIGAAQGLFVQINQAQKVINSTAHTRVIVMLQGAGPGPSGNAQCVVMQTDPEFAQITTLVQACAARNQAAQQTALAAIGTAIAAAPTPAPPVSVVS